MIDRQRVDQHVVFGEAPIIDQTLGIRGEIVMRQHRALGTAGGARRVEDRGEIVIGAADRCERRIGFGGSVGQRSPAIGSERLDPGFDLGRDRPDAFGPGGIAHHQRRLGVADEICQLVQRIGGVERQIHRTRAHGGEIEHQRRHRLLGLRCNAVARFDAPVHQHIRHLAGAGNQIGIADAGAVEHLDREPRGIVEMVEQAGKQVGAG